jgi:hypothetical protein
VGKNQGGYQTLPGEHVSCRVSALRILECNWTNLGEV